MGAQHQAFNSDLRHQIKLAGRRLLPYRGALQDDLIQTMMIRAWSVVSKRPSEHPTYYLTAARMAGIDFLIKEMRYSQRLISLQALTESTYQVDTKYNIYDPPRS